MSPKKLTETDKKQILELYRLPEETTSTLANRYSVSSSTISRFLKSTLNESEYEDLIQQKRLSRTAKPSKSKPKKQTAPTLEESEPAEAVKQSEPAETLKKSQPADATETNTANTIIKKNAVPKKSIESPPSSSPSPIIKKTSDAQLALEFEEDDDFYDEEEAEFIALEEMLGEDIADDDLEDEEEDDWDEDTNEEDYHLHSESLGINILPLSEAPTLRTCYLVIDRGAELITKPLKDFADLGQIPPEEIQQKTLPIFENHRVAKRFSNRSQRVIKVPDGRILQKTGNYLQAKGITRLLIDGKVYSVSS